MTHKISVNEQSSIRIEAEKTLYFDPLNIGGEPHDADIIFITHEHHDHFSTDDIAKVVNDRTVLVAPKSMADAVGGLGLPSDRLTLLAPNDTAEVLGIAVEAVPAYNNLKPFHPKKNGWLGYVVTVDGSRVYVCGDTDATDDAKAVKCDILCLPIGGTFTMDPKKAAELAAAIKPAVAVPTHYGTIVGKPKDADEFEKLVGGSVKVERKLSF